MCGCGTLFCRRCSPSAVFCAHCHQQHQQAGRHAAKVAVAHPGWGPTPRHHSHTPRPLSQRVLIEALLMTILATLALAAMMGIQNPTLAETVSQISSGGDSSVSYGIDADIEPLQKDTALFKTSMPVSGGTAALTSDSTYTINARVESVKAYDDVIGDLVPYDLLLAWGEMADDEVGSKLMWEQGDRKGQVSGSLGGPGGVDLSHDYVVRHISNNHIIASTDRIDKALKNIRPGDMVRIDGRLVDIRISMNDGRIVTVDSSKSRTDQGEGACEIIYVEHLRVNGQLY